ncbi:MAG: tail fiber domain-containing protein, partial [Bdellovibrio sp.]
MNGHTGSALKNAAVMKAIATGDFSVSPTADLTFWTNGGGAAATERMRITAGGNVGIGTTAPGRQLVIDGGVADVSTGKATLEIVTSSTTYGPRLRLNSTGAWGREFLLISTQAADTAGAGKFSIYDSTASVNRMIIDSTGNVGIGTTAPKTLFETQVPNASGAATVAGTFSMTSFTGSTNNEVKVLLGPTNLPADSAGISASRRVPGSTGFSIYTGNAGTSLEAVHIKGNGNVGIGTATPSQKLEIPGTWASTLFSGDNVVIRKPNYVGAWARNLMQFEEYDGTVLNALGVYGTNNSFTYGYIGTSWSSPSIVWKPSGNVGIGTTTPAASLVVNKTAPTGTIASTGTAVSGTGTNFTTAFSVGDQIIANGQAKTITVITDAANMTVNTAFSSDLTAGTTYTRVGTILSAGNVGIGTSQPLYSLHVNGDANLGGVIFKGQTDYDSSASVYPIISRSAAGGSGVFPFNTSGNLVLAPRADGSNIVFATGATTPQTRMVISGSGNVGIGTSSPAAALDVNGTASIGVSGKVNISAAGVISSSVNGNYIPINISNPTGYAHILVNNSVDFGSGGTDGYIKLHDNSKGIFLDSSGIRFNYASGTEAARINSSGNLGIGITNPGYKLDVNGDTNIASGSALRFGGTQVCTSAGCTSSSDRNLKESIQPLQNSLEKILKLQGVEYDYKDKVKFTDKHQVGVIAQDVEKVYPEVVLKDPKTGLRSVAYDHLVGPLIEAFKSLYQRVVGIEAHQATQDRMIASKADQEALNAAHAKIQMVESENARLKSRAD